MPNHNEIDQQVQDILEQVKAASQSEHYTGQTTQELLWILAMEAEGTIPFVVLAKVEEILLRRDKLTVEAQDQLSLKDKFIEIAAAIFEQKSVTIQQFENLDEIIPKITSINLLVDAMTQIESWPLYQAWRIIVNRRAELRNAKAIITKTYQELENLDIKAQIKIISNSEDELAVEERIRSDAQMIANGETVDLEEFKRNVLNATSTDQLLRADMTLSMTSAVALYQVLQKQKVSLEAQGQPTMMLEGGE